MTVAPGRPASAQARIVERIARDLAGGSRRSGEALPPVRELAAELGFDPGTVQRAMRALLARGLVRAEGRATRRRLVLCEPPPALLAGTLAVVTTHRHAQMPAEPGWSIWEFAGVVEAAAAAGHPLLVMAPHELDGERLRRLRADGVIGLVVVGEGSEAAAPMVAAAVAAGMPTAVHAPLFDGLACDRADSDHEAGGRLIAGHLLAAGRRRLATVWPRRDDRDPDRLPWSRSRQAGIAQACAAAGAPAPLRRVWQAPHGREAWIAAAMAHLADLFDGERAVDGLLVHSDGDVPWTIEALRRLGRSAHDDIAVAGYDHYWRPDAGPGPCVSIDKDNRAVGRALVDLATARAGGRAGVRPGHVLIVPRLVVHRAVTPRAAVLPR